MSWHIRVWGLTFFLTVAIGCQQGLILLSAWKPHPFVPICTFLCGVMLLVAWWTGEDLTCAKPVWFWLGVVQIRVSAVLTNGAYLLNVDCDHYFNNCKALKEAMCFMMDPLYGKKTCYVQFPQRFDGIDMHDRYANRNIVFFDVCSS